MHIFLISLLCLMMCSPQLFAQRFELVWSDEFDQTEFDEATWTEWEGTAFNDEHQYYTPRDTNVYVDDGMLYLVGLREDYEGRQWTSGRIKTQDNFEFQYGKVEIRAKLPAGKGLWPAFWMLGSNIDEAGIGWPYCGEIDIMEYRGHLPTQTNGTVHFSAVEPDFPRDPNGDRRLIGEEYDLPSGSFAEDFHLYQFEWTDSVMIWSVNDVEFFKLTREEIQERTSYYPFDQPFYLILNLAIGGNFLGDQQPDESTPDRNEVIVDYVRVYQDINKEPEIELNYDSREQIESTQKVNLEANVTDEDGTVEKVQFLINDEVIKTDSIPPYSANWRPGIDGCYELEIKAYDNDNGVGKSNEKVIFEAGTGCTKRSFHDAPHSFPGTLQFEHYDYGGLGNSYHDTTPDTNLGNGQGNDFRTTEAVDIIPDVNEEGNYLISNTAVGEWTTYELTIDQTGIYDIELRVIPGSGIGRINFSLDNEEWIYFTRIISQEDQYYTYKTATGVEVQKGTYDLKMEIALDGDGLKPDHLKAVFKESTSNEELSDQPPASVQLDQNFPNPFNPTTNISFELPFSQQVSLDIYNSLGQHVRTLYSGILSTGSHLFTFDANELSSGIYYYLLETPNMVLTRKMLLLK